MRARVVKRLDLALSAALAKAAGDQDPVTAREDLLEGTPWQRLGVDKAQVDARVVGDPAVEQRLV